MRPAAPFSVHNREMNYRGSNHDQNEHRRHSIERADAAAGIEEALGEEVGHPLPRLRQEPARDFEIVLLDRAAGRAGSPPSVVRPARPRLHAADVAEDGGHLLAERGDLAGGEAAGALQRAEVGDVLPQDDQLRVIDEGNQDGGRASEGVVHQRLGDLRGGSVVAGHSRPLILSNTRPTRRLISAPNAITATAAARMAIKPTRSHNVDRLM